MHPTLMVKQQTVLNSDQARKRAGLTSDGHNHGEDWGSAGTSLLLPAEQRYNAS